MSYFHEGFDPYGHWAEKQKSTAFDEIYADSITFTPAEEYDECNLDPNNWEDLIHPPDVIMKTVGTAHISVEFDYSGVSKEVMVAVFGVDRYMGVYGRHRIHDETLWEYKAFDGFEGLPQNAYGAFFFNKPKERIPLCPIGLGRK